MQILYVNEDAPTPQIIKVSTDFKLKHIQWNKGIYGKVVCLPYADTNIPHMLGAPINLIAWEHDIAYPDFEKSKVAILVDQPKHRIQFLIIIYPLEKYANTQEVKPVHAKFDVKFSLAELIKFKCRLIFGSKSHLDRRKMSLHSCSN